MKSIQRNVILTTSEEQMHILWNKHWGIFEWLRYLHLKTSVNIFNGIDTLFDFEDRAPKKTRSSQLIELRKNKDDYEEYALNIYSHSRTKIWISENQYNGFDYKWDGGEIAFIFIKKDWKYKDKFIKLLNDSCSLWSQYENGSFDWVYDLSDEDTKTEYWDRMNADECKCHNCENCIFYPTIDEMKDKINEVEIEFYDYKDDKFGLEFIVEDLFGVNNV